MRAAAGAGASMINDVRALQDEGALGTAAALQVAVCVMHMRGQPRDMQKAPVYVDVVSDVERFLLARAEACRDAGIPAASIVIDPGFGFGKTFQHNVELFRAIPHFAGLGFRVMVGVSRKSMIGVITGNPVDDRDVASAVAALLAARSGASILRVHDAAATRDALRTAAALDTGA
jgi:dihydropteroate synthase